MQPLNTLSATEIVALTLNGTVNCETLARECLARVAAREPVVKAWAFIDLDQVLREAKALDSRANRGPLFGVPVGVKDIIETADMPTQMGSPIYRGYRTLSDAGCVAQLRAAGALIVGKTVTCEFAGPAANVTTNPHNAARTPGGSSSGSAAAVADFMVPFGFGTQTGGSVQRPASYCGIVGYKPTFGLINRQGVKPAAESLDTMGLMVRTVEDAALFMQVLTNSAKVQWLPADAPIRIGLCRTYAWKDADEATRNAVENAARRLEKVGFSVCDVALPPPCEGLPRTREIINDYERARGMAWEWNTHADKITDALGKSIRNGLVIPRAQYIEALEQVALCRHRVAALFTDVDVLLTPAADGEAPLGLAHTGHHRFQSIWTQLRTPTVTLPTDAGPSGMPVGIQLVGAHFADDRLLAIAQRVFALLGQGPRIEL
ncbi:amidase [Undibacter mobilis]|uniref:amidase n=1 Tax=Undibacter mobilis TaxID=2292256 RepID=UPI00143D5D17|nr:amidase [Undibacter mobilis]